MTRSLLRKAWTAVFGLLISANHLLAADAAKVEPPKPLPTSVSSVVVKPAQSAHAVQPALATQPAKSTTASQPMYSAQVAELTAKTIEPTALPLPQESTKSTNPSPALRLASDNRVEPARLPVVNTATAAAAAQPAESAVVPASAVSTSSTFGATSTVMTNSVANEAAIKTDATCDANCTNGASCSNCSKCGCKACCCECGPPGRYWIRDEYLGFWMSGGYVPALVNTSPDGTLPATETLYGDQTYNTGYRSGNWVQGGMWFDDCQTRGIQADYFFLGQQSSPFYASSNGDPILTRPFIDATTGQPAEQLVAVPGIVVGNVSVENNNWLQGAGVSLRRNLWCCEDCCTDCCKRDWCETSCARLDFVYGFRYYNFNDTLRINEQLTSIAPNTGVPIGTQFDVSDSFVTRNNFYGGEIGLIYERYRGRWMYEATAKVALGGMNSVVNIDGSTVVSFPGQPTAFNEGGLLALSSNIGRHESNNFVAIPQFSLRLGYRATERLTLMAGYTLMYFNEIAFAGEQIDTTVNPNLIPPPIAGGPDRPAFNFNPSDLVLQGITLGAEFSF